jgi:Zn-dependent membrane protease YugP
LKFEAALGSAALIYVAGLATALLELIRMIALATAVRDRE